MPTIAQSATPPSSGVRNARPEAVVRFENVGLRYGLGPEVLQDVTFTLPAGSFHFLVGPSGAGKSSLLKLMYLALAPTRGLINLFGRDIATTPRRALPALRRRIGVVFQEFRLLSHLTTFDNVALPLRVAGSREEEVRRHVTELLGWVGLKEHMQARPPTLSGGQQQQVAIARAVIARPRLLLADEPTGNIDDHMAMRLMHLFVELNKLGTTVVVATHNEAMVERMGFPVLRLDADPEEPGRKGPGPPRRPRLATPEDEAALIADAFEAPARSRPGQS